MLRISLDTKAKVKIGEFSRNGKVRTRREIKGLDHDHNPKAVLVPLGILNTETNRTDIIFGNSSETSDFIVDGIEIWWEANQKDYPHIKKLMINLDNGPSVSGNRTQFLKRMAAFSKQNNLKIHLVYYPPYHSKYNPVERCWSALERHWNGSILSSVEIAVNWASTLTWKGIKTCVRFVDKVYEKGITLTKREMMKYETQIKRSADLPKWDIIISPLSG